MSQFTLAAAQAAIAAARPGQLQTIVDNAKRLLPGDIDAIRVAHFRRLAEVHGTADPDFERALWATIEVFRPCSARKVNRASRNIRHIECQIAMHGPVAATAKMVTGPASSGFHFLIERGLAEITAEALVLRFAHLFDPKVVERARARLSDVGAV